MTGWQIGFKEINRLFDDCICREIVFDSLICIKEYCKRLHQFWVVLFSLVIVGYLMA